MLTLISSRGWKTHSHPKKVYRRLASLAKSLQYLYESRAAADPKDEDGGHGHGSTMAKAMAKVGS